MQLEGEKWEASPKTLKCGGELHSAWKKGGKGRELKKNASGKHWNLMKKKQKSIMLL